MSQRTILIDDMDGDTADATVSFALEGTHYEIDLKQSNVKLLRDALAPFIQVARSRTEAARPATSRPRKKRSSDSKVIRAWAEANGISVPRRGRIPVNVVAQYEKAS